MCTVGPTHDTVFKWYKDDSGLNSNCRYSYNGLISELNRILGPEASARNTRPDGTVPRTYGNLSFQLLEKRLQETWNKDFKFDLTPEIGGWQDHATQTDSR